MRILHLCSRYWPGLGGGENYMREVSERLAADGHQVTVATTDADETELFWNPAKRRLAQPQAQHGGVRILRFPLRHLPFSPLSYSVWRYLVFWGLAATPFVPTTWLIKLSRFTPWSPELWRWVATTSETFDAVGAMGILYEPFVAAAVKAARRWQVPGIVYPLTHLGAGSRPGQDAVSRYYTMRHQVALVRSADWVVTMTPTESAFYERRGLPRERICVAAPGVNPEQITGGNALRFRERHQIKGPVIAFLSALAYDKGATHVVEAVRRLWAQGQPVDLVMAGTVWPQFRNYFDQLPDAERSRVRLLGQISEADKRDLLAAADVVAMPSRTDSFGIIYLEAWLYRKPVVGAQAWGMSDVIRDGVDGLLVPFGDVAGLAAQFGALLRDPAWREALGAAGAQKVYADYTWDRIYHRLRALYTHRRE